MSEDVEFLDPGERYRLIEAKNTFDFPATGFRFIDDHKGFRKQRMHVLMATTGVGKTTLSRSLLIKMLESGKKVFLYSSEETLVEIKTELAQSTVSDSSLKHLTFLHEDEVLAYCGNDENNIDSFMEYLRFKLARAQPDLLLVDNLTTSVFYDGKINVATKLVAFFKTYLRESDTAGLFIAHTKDGSDDNKGYISASDVRGSKSLTNKAEFLYVYQRIKHTTADGKMRFYPIITVDKSRGYDCRGRKYRLKYNPGTQCYVDDAPIDHNAFNELYASRDQLGRKPK